MNFSCRVFLVIFWLLPAVAPAQTWEFGVFAGGTGYMGDLNTARPYQISHPAFGGQIKRNFNPNWSVRLNIMHGQVGANDAHSPNAQNRVRNLSFFSPLTEFGLQVEYNFFDYIPSLSKKLYTPFLFTGIGEVDFNPKARMGGEVFPLNLYGTEGQDASHRYKTSAVSIPVGLGLKWNVTGNWSLVGELGYRTAFTDYLDDVSRNYPDKTLLINPTAVALSDRSGEYTGVYVGNPGTQRGDYRRRDTYLFTGFSLTYTIISSKCPVVN